MERSERRTGGLAQRTTADPYGTPKRVERAANPSVLASFPAFSLIAHPPPFPIPNVSVVSKRHPFVRRAAYGGRRDRIMWRRAQRTTAEPLGTPRNTQKGRLRPRIRLFYAPPAFLFSFPARPLSQYLTFRWFRNALHLPEGRNRGRRDRIMWRRAQRTTAEPHGTPRNTQKSR